MCILGFCRIETSCLGLLSSCHAYVLYMLDVAGLVSVYESGFLSNKITFSIVGNSVAISVFI